MDFFGKNRVTSRLLFKIRVFQVLFSSFLLMNPIFLLQKMYGLNEKLFKELFDFHVKRPDYNGTVVMSLQCFILGHTAVISVKAK